MFLLLQHLKKKLAIHLYTLSLSRVYICVFF